MRKRLKEYESYIRTEKLKIEQLNERNKINRKSNCLGKDEAFRWKHNCSNGPIIRVQSPKRDAELEADILHIKESYILKECFGVKSIREAKQNGCLPK